MQPLYIGAYDEQGGLREDKKPFLLPDQAFSQLENAFVFRDRVHKRECLQLLGRLRRTLTSQSLGNTVGAQTTYTYNTIFSSFVPPVGASETNKEIEPGSLIITIAAPDAATFTDDGIGGFTVTGVGVALGSSINYATGVVVIVVSAAAGGAAITANINYHPGLPVMGIDTRERPSINSEQTIFFDTTYAYTFSSPNNSTELATGTTWTGTDADFFWTTNYRGITPDVRIFFATNFVNNSSNPVRYYDGAWNSFYPVVSQSGGVATRRFITQARIIIPYFGRLVMLNTWEGGADVGGNPDYSAPANFFNRCSFSQIGNPLESTVALPVIDTAWRIDQFGRGGFIDAPTNEMIVSAAFFQNTLLVFFERSTWILRYVGEQGLPFIWERVSSDYGSESTFSPILFDKFVAAVGDRAIIAADTTQADRIDLQVPDKVFSFRNLQNGPERVHGIRDFFRELVFWCYSDSNFDRKFPNRVLVYNYRNNTYAVFRDSVTAFGEYQSQDPINWDRTDILWDDDSQLWESSENQEDFVYTTCGNQQGFIHLYGYTTPDEESLSIHSMNTAVSPYTLTVPNHNLETGEIIRVTGCLYSSVPTVTLNGEIFRVQRDTADVISLFVWDGTDYGNPVPVGASAYIGGGTVTLLPKLYVATKDFNPFSSQGFGCKVTSIDFLTDAPEGETVTTPTVAMTVQLFINSSLSVQANLAVGNQEVETELITNFNVPASDYAWHRFFATANGQFIRIVMTYDDALMQEMDTHENGWVLEAMRLYVRPGSRNTF